MSITAEGVGIPNTSLTGGYITQPISTYVGSTTVSLQLHDRSGPLGFDQVIFATLQNNLDRSFDTALITAIITGATTTYARATTWGVPQYWADVAKSGCIARNPERDFAEP